MTSLLFNPSVRIAGTKALLLGWLFIVLTAFIAYFSHCHFDGAIDAHQGSQSVWWLYLAEPLLAWLCTVLMFYITGRIASSSKVRLVDIAGTMALARWPMLFVALLFFIPVTLPANRLDIPPALILFSLVVLVFSIWMLALMYNAYRVSCNVKGSKAVISFIVALILTEVLSKFVFDLLYKTVLRH